MSSCANIVNRLQSDMCLQKENFSFIDYSALILKMNQGIFFQSPLIVYIIPDTSPNAIGIPLNVEVSYTSSSNTSTYAALLITDRFGREPADILEYTSIVYTTETLLDFGQRTPTGFFEMTSTLPIVLIDANPDILPTLTRNDVLFALQSCRGVQDNHTVTWGPYNALQVFLKNNYGIRYITPSLAACFYEFFNQNSSNNFEPVVQKEVPVVYLPVHEKSVTERSVVLSEPERSVVLSEPERSVVLPEQERSVVLPEQERSVVLPEQERSVVLPEQERSIVLSEPERSVVLSESKRSVVLPEPKTQDVINFYDACKGACPFEPFEPFDPRSCDTLSLSLKQSNDFLVETKQIEDSATTTVSTTESSNNNAIEEKLRALLEATETSEVTL